MLDTSTSDARVSIPSHWRRVSFLCFDLGVLHIIGGIGTALFHSRPLYALGFCDGSLWLGLLFIALGLGSYKARRFRSLVPITVIAAALCFLPTDQLKSAVVLLQYSFLMPLVLTLISI